MITRKSYINGTHCILFDSANLEGYDKRGGSLEFHRQNNVKQRQFQDVAIGVVAIHC